MCWLGVLHLKFVTRLGLAIYVYSLKEGNHAIGTDNGIKQGTWWYDWIATFNILLISGKFANKSIDETSGGGRSMVMWSGLPERVLT